MILKLLIFAVAITAVSAGQFNLDKQLLKNPSLVKAVFGKSFDNREDCVVDGFKCLDCLRSQYCFQIPGQDWIVEETLCSNSGGTCSTETGQCTSGPNLECDHVGTPYKFQCYQMGLFPHPYECRKFHLCSVDDDGNVIQEPRVFECKEGLVYDSVTTLCAKKKTCEPRLEGSCTVVGSTGSVIGNPSMFYTCLFTTIDDVRHLIPHLFNCANGERYINGDCRDPTPPGPELDANGKCIQNKNYYHPEGCIYYIWCRVGEDPDYSFLCPATQYFDGWKHECVRYQCKL